MAELLIVLMLGAARPGGIAHSQPLLWMASHAARTVVPVAVALGAGAMSETTIAGPAAVIAQPAAPPAPPSASP